jgi:hypothetical protein
MPNEQMMIGPSLHMLNGADRARREAAEQRLLRAAQDEWTALHQWSHSIALLVAGRTWDVVRLPSTMLDADFDHETEPAALPACITRLGMIGPAFCDPYRTAMHFLVPPGTNAHRPHEEFRRTQIACLRGANAYEHHVGVPRIDRTRRPGRFWVVPPDSVTHRHVDADHLLALLCQKLAEVEAAPGGVR